MKEKNAPKVVLIDTLITVIPDLSGLTSNKKPCTKNVSEIPCFCRNYSRCNYACAARDERRNEHTETTETIIVKEELIIMFKTFAAAN